MKLILTLLLFIGSLLPVWGVESIQEAAGIPTGLSDTDFQRLQQQKQSLDKDRELLLSEIEKLNADCSRVSAKDTAAVDSCRERQQILKEGMSSYHQEVGLYQSAIEQAQAAANEFIDSDRVDLRDAPSNTVNIAAVKGGPRLVSTPPPQPPTVVPPPDTDPDYLWYRQKREEAANEPRQTENAFWWPDYIPDPETRWINPLWIEEVKGTFNPNSIELEAALNDPQMQEITKKSCELGVQNKKYKDEFFSTLETVKSELRSQNLGSSEQQLDITALKDPRVDSISRQWMAFEKVAAEREKELDKQFFARLKVAKEELADKKAEQVLRDQWRREKKEKEGRKKKR